MARYSDNYKMTLPQPQDYYDVEVFNNNFKIIDKALLKSGKDRTIVASFDTDAYGKAVADYVCDENNAQQTLQQAVSSLKYGGELFLMEGTYYINSCLRINKSIVIKGRGCHFTKLIKNQGTEALINICADAVTIEGVMLVDDYDDKDNLRDMLLLGKSDAHLKNVFFVQKGQQLAQSSMVRLVADSEYIRIDNCRFFREYSLNERCMLNLGRFKFSGCIMGNFISGNDNFSINFCDEESRDNTIVYGNHKTDIYINLY